jgi:hypothetical protein
MRQLSDDESEAESIGKSNSSPTVGIDGVGWDDIASPVKLLQAKVLGG